MNKHDKKTMGLGTLIYMEWVLPIVDYYHSLRRNELIYEVVIPAVIAIICTLIYWEEGKLHKALNGIADVMPTAIAVLIGFTVMLITLLLTSSGSGIDNLKKIETNKKIHDVSITLYQGLFIQFSHSLFSEVFILLLIFFYMFLEGLTVPVCVGIVILDIEIYLTLNVLLSVLRGVTNLYFSLFRQ